MLHFPPTNCPMLGIDAEPCGIPCCVGRWLAPRQVNAEAQVMGSGVLEKGGAYGR
ncbi:MAG: hypothetical protein LBC63_09200 [Holophagales bacterium]|jgi:hypothetical protein|nr:hypothetical protein [Holophagales bacterium]